jgi:hypothetical protein
LAKRQKRSTTLKKKKFWDSSAIKRKFLSFTVVRPLHVPVIYGGYSNASDSTLVE